MSTAQPHDTRRKPLRVWPGVIIALAALAVTIVYPLIMPDGSLISMISIAVGGLGILVWWLLFSRARWFERVGVVAFMPVAVVVLRPLMDASVVGAGMGNLYPALSVILMAFALVVWATVTLTRSDRVRRAWLAPALLLAIASFALVRTGGVSGTGGFDLHWRWTPTPEQLLLARTKDEPLEIPSAAKAVAPPAAVDAKNESSEPKIAAPSASATPTAPVSTASAVKTNEPVAIKDREAAVARASSVAKSPEWPGFRGPGRDGIVRDVRIETDWSATPPKLMWRRGVGPGWSSFAVQGDFFYTQEQRGEDEIVAAYRMTTGQPVWRHADPTRFYESNGGAGPRGTPTLHEGRVYTLGATGILNALDATNGAVVWSRNAAKDANREIPEWGFSSSPLIVDDLVVVALYGRLAAYDRTTGNPRWLGTAEGGGYSSPQLATIDGVPQILLMRGRRTTSVAPADGKQLWEHLAEPSASIVQPALTANGDVLVATSDAMGGLGVRRVALAHGSSGWTVSERWLSRGLKPYFNDFVVHKGYAYGFDNSILSCINLEDGNRVWKGGRYGNGQLVLLRDQDVLLVVSEDGELALVNATPDQFKELARLPALDGKTWNHPVVVHDVLLVRNGADMAAFRLPLAR